MDEAQALRWRPRHLAHARFASIRAICSLPPTIRTILAGSATIRESRRRHAELHGHAEPRDARHERYRDVPIRRDRPPALPKIKAAAREAFGAPDALITAMEASKPLDRASADLKVLWEVEFRQANWRRG